MKTVKLQTKVGDVIQIGLEMGGGIELTYCLELGETSLGIPCMRNVDPTQRLPRNLVLQILVTPEPQREEMPEGEDNMALSA